MPGKQIKAGALIKAPAFIIYILILFFSFKISLNKH
jgi:hypothetical protein